MYKFIFEKEKKRKEKSAERRESFKLKFKNSKK